MKDPDTGVLYSYTALVAILPSLTSVGLETEMTAEEEELLAEGKNFEHSGGAVDTGRIELALRSHCLIANALKHLEQAEGTQGQACPTGLLVFSFLMIIIQSISQAVLREYIQQRSPTMAKSLKEKSNFSRYLRFHHILSKNPALLPLFTKEMDEKGNQTAWSLDKVPLSLVCFPILFFHFYTSIIDQFEQLPGGRTCHPNSYLV